MSRLKTRPSSTTTRGPLPPTRLPINDYGTSYKYYDEPNYGGSSYEVSSYEEVDELPTYTMPPPPSSYEISSSYELKVPQPPSYDNTYDEPSSYEYDVPTYEDPPVYEELPKYKQPTPTYQKPMVLNPKKYRPRNRYRKKRPKTTQPPPPPPEYEEEYNYDYDEGGGEVYDYAYEESRQSYYNKPTTPPPPRYKPKSEEEYYVIAVEQYDQPYPLYVLTKST